jgi:DNA-binding response OmpR family regulator
MAGLETCAVPENCMAVVADDAVPEAQIREWEKGGMPVTILKNLENGSGRLRLGHVLLRLRQLRQGAANGTVFFGPFSLDLAHLVLTNSQSGATIILTEKERDILLRLHREKGRPLDRKALLGDIWGYASVIETHTLETHIYRLRQKLENDPSAPQVLMTEGSGYLLVME